MTQDGNADFAWGPTASLEVLARRAELLRQLRSFFDERGFLEVETPVLSRDTVVDRHLEPLRVEPESGPDGLTLPCSAFLQTSPEFHMKRLLAAGAEAIYQVSRAFRGAEVGPVHNLEFTMVEWYQVGDTYHDAIARLADLAERLLGGPRPTTVTYRELFQRHLGLDPHVASPSKMMAAAHEAGAEPPPSLRTTEDRDAWLFFLLSEVIEPRMAEQSLILIDYPASQSALARVSKDDCGALVARRFELYVHGLELANGYWELLDARELRARNTIVNEQRQRDGRPRLPSESRLLAAMEAGLPDCCGVALGFDRLVMCALGVQKLREVMPFPWPDHA